MILLSKKGAHGLSDRYAEVCMLLPQWSQGSTLRSHVPIIADSISVANQTNPVGPVYMASTSQTASSNRQAMTTPWTATALPALVALAV